MPQPRDLRVFEGKAKKVVVDETLPKHHASATNLLLKKTEKIFFLEAFVGALGLSAAQVNECTQRVMAAHGLSGIATATSTLAATIPKESLAATSEAIEASTRAAEYVKVQRQLQDAKALIATLTARVDAARSASAEDAGSTAAALHAEHAAAVAKIAAAHAQEAAALRTQGVHAAQAELAKAEAGHAEALAAALAAAEAAHATALQTALAECNGRWRAREAELTGQLAAAQAEAATLAAEVSHLQAAAARDTAQWQQREAAAAASLAATAARAAAAEAERDAFMGRFREVDAKRASLLEAVIRLKGNVRVFARVRPFLPGEHESDAPFAAGAAAGIAPSKLAAATGGSKKKAAAASRPLLFQFPDARDDATALEFVEPPGAGVGGYGVAAEGKRTPFEYQRVFGPHAPQGEVFAEVEPVVQCALDGHRVTVLCYGQTGACGVSSITRGGCAAQAVRDVRAVGWEGLG
jgi:hypothetical protein